LIDLVDSEDEGGGNSSPSASSVMQSLKKAKVEKSLI
jgi:hypothetical protein